MIDRVRNQAQGRWQRWAALLLVLALFAQLLASATQLSATIDEGFHITSGYEYVRTGKLRLFDEHTPVAKALFAWPLFFVPDLTSPENAAAYASGNLIAVAQATTLAYRPLDRVIVAPRIAAVLLTLVLAATIYRCTSILAGPMAGLLALGLCTFDPNFLAHGSLATTDMGATAFSFWAMWAGTRWLKRPTHRRWWSAALLLGLAQGAKLTALLIYPVLGLGVLLDADRQRRQGSESPFIKLWSFVGIVVLSLCLLWALYGFELRPIDNILGGTIPLPAASHIERWQRLRENLAYGRESFLMGQNSMHGWALYFPIAFLVKTPLPILILLSMSLLRAMHGMWNLTSSVSHVTFYSFPLLYALASLTSPINIGYRHLLPVLPFLYIGVARSTSLVPFHVSRLMRHAIRVIQYLLLIWLALSTLYMAPHYLAFFNHIAGGPDNGWRFLADSNTDWGQTFKALAEYQDKSALGTVNLSTFIFYDPAAYGVDYRPIAPMTGAPPVLPQRFNPAPGIYAISATTLDGVPLPYPPTYDWFRHQTPFAKIGHVMFLYDVQSSPGTWIAQCSTPVAPLANEAINEGFGISDLRQVSFDCEQSWVLPGGGSTSGWIARVIPEQTHLRWPTKDTLSADLLPGWLDRSRLADLSLHYLQPRHGALPAFAVWRCSTCDLNVPQSPTALESPIVLEETVAFLGMSAPATAKPGSSVKVTTFWEVLRQSAQPLSIMLHLRRDNGEPIAVGDGLGFPTEQWQAGDRFAQSHQLVIPNESAPGEYTLHTGAYWLDGIILLSQSAQLPPVSLTLLP
jgi:hypothetical protein